MKGAEELGELLFECSKRNDKVLDWYNEALAMLSLGIIELTEALEHPEIFISEETFNALKEAVKCREGS